MTQPASSARQPEKRRLFYVDNLRIFLTALVICHHVGNTYSVSGMWYYREPQPQGSISPLVLTMFLAVNQSFFMSLFFTVSAFFTPMSYERKGPALFLKDRLLRLGVPLVAYFFVLNPSLEYIIYRFKGETQAGYFNFMAANIIRESGTGPLWFVMTLLIFAIAFVAIRVVAPERNGEKSARPLPKNIHVAGFILCIGLFTFLVRIWYPVGRTIFDLQLAYFPLYICMYIFGVWACRFSWFDELSRRQANQWFGASVGVIALMPVTMMLGGAFTGGTDVFLGGMSWQAYVYAGAEPVLCIGVSMKLLTLFRDRLNTENWLTRRMAKSAYTAYIIHPYFVVCSTFLVANVSLDPLLKFLVASPLAVSSCFLVSDVVRRAPLLRRIL